MAAARPSIRIIEGRFQQSHRYCASCGGRWTTFIEKETDVNLAAALIKDAVMDRYDTALPVSADADLCPAVRAVRQIAPTKRVVAVFPPRRRSEALRHEADAAFMIGDAKIRQAQLPDKIIAADGTAYSRPDYWR